MNLTLEQVEQMAPDAAAAAAGRKLMAVKNWSDLGQSPEALWGKCQGSAVYQVKVDLSNFGYNCSCPSRKFPCKHVLGLFMLAVQSPRQSLREQLPVGSTSGFKSGAPAKRSRPYQSRSPRRGGRRQGPAAANRAAQKLVRDGLDRLDLWMQDLVRAGIAELAARPSSLWEEQARRLVDAQAPDWPRASPAWLSSSFGAGLGEPATWRTGADRALAPRV